MVKTSFQKYRFKTSYIVETINNGRNVKDLQFVTHPLVSSVEMLEMTELGNKDSPQLPFLTSARKSLQYPRILTTSQHQPMIKRLQGHRFRGSGSLFSLFQCHPLVTVLLRVRWI